MTWCLSPSGLSYYQLPDFDLISKHLLVNETGLDEPKVDETAIDEIAADEIAADEPGPNHTY